MNVAQLKQIADSATAHGKACSGSIDEQYIIAKRYVHCTQVFTLSPQEHEFIIKRIADRLGI